MIKQHSFMEFKEERDVVRVYEHTEKKTKIIT